MTVPQPSVVEILAEQVVEPAEGPVVFRAMPVCADLAARAPDALLNVWSAVASVQVDWSDGGLRLMTPAEAREEIEIYVDLLKDERDDPNEHYELAVQTLGHVDAISPVPVRRLSGRSISAA